MDEKTKGVLAYVFSIVTGIIFLCLKDSSKTTKIHSAQAIVIFCLYIIASIVVSVLLTPILLVISWSMLGIISFLNFVIFAGYAALIIWGIIKVVNEDDPALPVVNGIAMSIFKKAIETGSEEVKTADKTEEPK